MIWAIIGGFALVAAIDLTPLIKKKKPRAIAAFISVFIIALTLAVLQVLKVEIPSVMYLWRDLILWLGLVYH